MMRYGTCYKGSKNKIAEWVCSHFPKAENFYDLFAGGCAITHYALLHKTFVNYFCNDISDSVFLFRNSIEGKYWNEKRWISRNDFFTLKDSDPYVKYAWSFGNNGRCYLYSVQIEPWKKALHYARVLGDFSELEKFGIKTNDASRKWIRENENYCRQKYFEWYKKEMGYTENELAKYEQYKKSGVFDNLIHGSVGIAQLKKRLQSLQSLQSLERLQSLQSLERLQSLQSLESLERLQSLQSLESLERLQSLQSLTVMNKSYDEVDILPDSVVYCDIPYKGTDDYGGSFDYDRFYNWCAAQKEIVLISEYSMPDDFICVDEINHRSALQSGQKIKTVEKIFVHKNQIDLYKTKVFGGWLFPEMGCA